ncbi:ribulose-phosphate 3-epimerase [Zavarzinella formosa]|uniref:ribulose-phosphate 3-epimerase n=1 Tax=Zavarzinella formosa TaxID=360055 RepID=UPI00038036BE|nr:ribulose-phosphate 3-epimerase [Zavarzinella formosa]
MIAPSILAADFSRLGQLVLETEAGGANRVHVDVMDGHFVPNLSMGPVVVKGLRPITRLPLEVHLMVMEPAKFVESFVKAGADSLIVHYEVLPDPKPLLREIRKLNCKAGLAINPGTPTEVLEPLIGLIDLALCMTVWPGFGGQAFLAESPARIAEIRALIERFNPTCELEVDGGVDLKTIGQCASNGANVFVAGTSVFGSPNGPRAAVGELTAMALEATKK